MKRCSRCHEEKPLSAFHRCAAKKDGRTPHCKECHHRDHYDRDVWRQRRFKRIYGITLAEYDALYAAQDGKCAMCREGNNGRGRLAVDHDHETGRVRGLLCFTCNTNLAWAERVGLSVLADYLQEVEDGQPLPARRIAA